LPNAAVKATEATAPEATEAATTASTRFMAGARPLAFSARARERTGATI